MTEIDTITSRDNAKLKLARRVRDGREPELMFVEGTRLCAEVLRSPVTIVDCFISDALFYKEGQIVQAIENARAAINRLRDDLFKTIADTDSPQGIVLVCKRPSLNRKAFEEAFSGSQAALPTVVLLHQVNNPSNLGAILRVAEAAGAVGVIVSRNSADPFSPKAIRSSMGSAFRLPIWKDVEMEEAIKWGKERGIIPTAADVAEGNAYTDIDWMLPRLLIFGSEAHGLSEAEKKYVDDLITIPMNCIVESLNLAVSAGVILFEAKRQINASGSRSD
ncbi:MAG: RNA methyltransferase [Acidobacteriota bacterium]